MRTIVLIMLSLIFCRCSSLETSFGLGAGIGAAGGFTASKLAGYNTKGTVIVTASSALIGGALGAILHKDSTPSVEQINPALLKGNEPPLRNAETDVIWVPDSVQDGKYVEGHRIWNITSPSHWQLKSPKEEQKTKSNGKSKNKSDSNEEASDE